MVSQFATRYCLEQFAKDTFHISTFDSAETSLENFKEALAAGTSLPEMIFLDLIMDEMDGWGFIDALEKQLGKKALPEIYVLSAFGNPKDRELAQKHPLILGYIDKPLTRNRLEAIFKQPTNS